MDAFFGASTARGPRSRVRQGSDALIRLDLELAETAFGVTRDLTVDTAVVCTTCAGAGTAPGTHPASCDTCGGRGEVQSVQRSFLGQVMTSRPCPTCAGTGTVIPTPVRQLRRRRPGPGPPDGAGQGAGRASRTGCGSGCPARARSAPAAARPATCTSRSTSCRTTSSPARATTCTAGSQLPMTAAALGTTLTLDTLDGDEEIDIRPGTQPDTVITAARPRRAAPARRRPRRPARARRRSLTPTRLDDEQEALLRELAELRGEDLPVSTRAHGGGGLFSKMRDAFNGR